MDSNSNFENSKYICKLKTISRELFELLQNSNVLHPEVLRFLETDQGFNAITRIEFERLEILINNCSDIDNDLRVRILYSILSDYRIIDKVNSMNFERFILLNEMYGLYTMFYFLQSYNDQHPFNIVHIEKLKLIINSFKSNNFEIGALLANRKVINTINSIKMKKFKAIMERNFLDEDGLLNLFQNHDNPYDHAIHSINIKWLRILYQEPICKKILIDILKSHEYINAIHQIDIGKFSLLIRNKTFFHEFDKNNISCFKCSMGNSDFELGALLANREVINTINSIEMKKFKVIIERNFLDEDGLLNLFQNHDNPCYDHAIHSINIKWLRILFHEPICKKSIIDILKSHKYINAIHQIDIGKFGLLVRNKIFCHEINNISCFKCSMGSLLDNATIPRIINLINNEYLKVILGCRWFFLVIVNVSLLDNDYDSFIDVIHSIDLERIELLVYSHLFQSHICRFWENRRYEYKNGICDDCDVKVRFLKNYPDIDEYLNSIDIEKLKIILLNKRFDITALFLLLSNENIIKALNLLDQEMIQILINSVNFRVDEIFSVMKKKVAVESIIGVGHEKIALLLTYYFLSDLNELVYDNILDSIKFISIEKLKLMLKRDNFNQVLLTRIVKNEKAFHAIQVIDKEKLENVLKMTDSGNFVAIMENCHLLNINRNLNYSIALYKVGKIDRVNWTFIQDTNAINEAVIKLFPESFPIDQILMPSKIPDEGFVSKLKDIYAQFIIEYTLSPECPVVSEETVNTCVLVHETDTEQKEQESSKENS